MGLKPTNLLSSVIRWSPSLFENTNGILDVLKIYRKPWYMVLRKEIKWQGYISSIHTLRVDFRLTANQVPEFESLVARIIAVRAKMKQPSQDEWWSLILFLFHRLSGIPLRAYEIRKWFHAHTMDLKIKVTKRSTIQTFWLITHSDKVPRKYIYYLCSQFDLSEDFLYHAL